MILFNYISARDLLHSRMTFKNEGGYWSSSFFFFFFFFFLLTLTFSARLTLNGDE